MRFHQLIICCFEWDAYVFVLRSIQRKYWKGQSTILTNKAAHWSAGQFAHWINFIRVMFGGQVSNILNEYICMNHIKSFRWSLSPLRWLRAMATKGTQKISWRHSHIELKTSPKIGRLHHFMNIFRKIVYIFYLSWIHMENTCALVKTACKNVFKNKYNSL